MVEKAVNMVFYECSRAGIIIVPQIRIDSALTRWSWITGKLDHGRLISR
jgi:hypothetical protein